jgi:hypothetical protein
MGLGTARTLDLSEKLRLTADLLGCASQKDLCAAFFAVNPATEFSLDRSYKWLQGRAQPRSGRIYEDWVKLLGLPCSPGWIASCSVREFASALGERHGEDAEVLLARLASSAAVAGAMPGAPAANDGVRGIYACFSHAQSPYYHGQIIRSALSIGATRGGGLTATYSQVIASGRVELRGPVHTDRRAVAITLVETPPDVAPAFLMLFPPTPPTSVLAGMLCNTVVVHPGNQPPFATRFVAIRVPPSAEDQLAASSGYIDATLQHPISDDLRRLGLHSEDDADVEGRILAVLRGRSNGPPGSDQVAHAEFAGLAAALDQFWLRSRA